MSRIILMTGATGKIGRVLVHYFLNAGDQVIATGRSKKTLNELGAEYSNAPGTFYGLQVDLLATGSIAWLLAELSRLHCMPDCLVNNARDATLLRMDAEGLVSRQDFLDELALDVVVPYELVMQIANAPGSRLRAVVNVGSQYGSVAPNLKLYTDPHRQSPPHYGVAKAALAHLTKELAVRLAEQRVRVNCVAFGGIEGRVDDAFKARYAALCPSGRMLTENEVAGPIDMLLSEATSSVTGHVMMADGGWSIW